MREKITSYDNATVGAGTVDNEVQFAYNDFGQLITDYQEHGAVVNTSTSPKVQYGYANGSANTIRPTSMTYPDGRVLTYDYGTSDATDDTVSRVSALVDDDGGSTHLAEYSYLGRNTFVEIDYTEPDLRHTLVGTAGGYDPDTGDIYLGLDRFGRVKDSMWYDYGASADADRVKHGYDRSGSRTYREHTVDANSNYDELYQYDQIDRLKQSDRGTLGGSKDSISSLTFAQCWSLDSTGNWKDFKQDDDGDSTWELEQSRTSNTVNEITDITETTGPSWITPLYNRAGNMTRIPQPSDPTQYYTATYDAWNRLAKLEDGVNTVAEYLYDGAKRRTIKKTYVAGSLDETRHFYYTEPLKWQVIEERLDSSSDPDRQFVWGLRYIDDLVLRDRDTSDPTNGTLDERLYAMQDANWNVTALAATDGTIQERFAYDAYGAPRVLTPAFATRATSSYAWETRFAGYRSDQETGAYSVRHRVFHPTLGWTQRDPLGYADGMNLYEYVRARPTYATDPTGLVYPLDNPYQSPGVEPKPPAPPAPPPAAAPVGTVALMGCIGGAIAGMAIEVLRLILTEEERVCVNGLGNDRTFQCSAVAGRLAGISLLSLATIMFWGATNWPALALMAGGAALAYLAFCKLCQAFGADPWVCKPAEWLFDAIGI